MMMKIDPNVVLFICFRNDVHLLKPEVLLLVFAYHAYFANFNNRGSLTSAFINFQGFSRSCFSNTALTFCWLRSLINSFQSSLLNLSRALRIFKWSQRSLPIFFFQRFV